MVRSSDAGGAHVRPVEVNKRVEGDRVELGAADVSDRGVISDVSVRPTGSQRSLASLGIFFPRVDTQLLFPLWNERVWRGLGITEHKIYAGIGLGPRRVDTPETRPIP
jgi:hypothetical protein